jgi:hypothetical protein
MARNDNPIILGRKLCLSPNHIGPRWLHTTDFKWRWRNPDATWAPTISNTCVVCHRRTERERYRSMDPDVKRAKIDRINERLKERRAHEQTVIESVRFAAEEKPYFEKRERVDFVPFRMWLLYQFSHNGGKSTKEYAREAGVSPDYLRDWLEGVVWTSRNCEPRPIQTIELKTVENVTTKLGHPEAAYILYPVAYE